MVMDPIAPALDTYSMQLSDALCAKLCHDLSSPLGTLMGALEMVAEDAGYAAEALPLANETATVMGQRIRLLRAAWAGDCGPLDVEDLTQLATGLPPRVRVNFDQLHQGPFSAPLSRVLVNLMLLAADALPRGGTVTVMGETDIIYTLHGSVSAWPEGLLAAITDPEKVSIDNPRAVQAPVVAMLARAAGLRLSLLLATGSVTGAPPLMVSAA